MSTTNNDELNLFRTDIHLVEYLEGQGYILNTQKSSPNSHHKVLQRDRETLIV